VHAVAAAASSVQLNVELGLLEVKEKLAVVWLVGFAGEAVMLATGELTVQVNETGAEAFPAVSVAITVKVWLAALNPE
jgi:hypothetical protein